MALTILGQAAEAADEARRSLAVAREIGYPAGEIIALGQPQHRRLGVR